MNLVAAFQEMQRIYGFCPCCGELFRLSDATISTVTRPPGTAFDQVRQAEQRLERQIEKFDDREEKIREEARLKGQRAARRRLRAIAPFLVQRKIEPTDVKVLFHPVEYVVFRGLAKESCSYIELVDHPPESRNRERLLTSIRKSIEAGNIEWNTFRVTDDGEVVSDGTREVP